MPLVPDRDPLPELLVRYNPCDAVQHAWIVHLAFAERSVRRVAGALEAVRARAGEGALPGDPDLLAALTRYERQVGRSRAKLLAEIEGMGLVAAEPAPVLAPAPAPAAAGRPRQPRRAGAGPPRLPARTLRVGGRKRPRFVLPSAARAV